MHAVDDSSILEKLTVCGTSFGFSCGAFFLSTAVLVPITGSLFNRLGFPKFLTNMTILVELVGLPIVGAVVGISLAARPILRRRFGRINMEM